MTILGLPSFGTFLIDRERRVLVVRTENICLELRLQDSTS